jgi:hypothetical protein
MTTLEDTLAIAHNPDELAKRVVNAKRDAGEEIEAETVGAEAH